jgi:hypothetical protein
MRPQVHVPLVRVWVFAAAIFLPAARISRSLARPETAMPSYWVGLVGLLAIGVALIMSWRGLGDPGVHTPMTRRILRGSVGLGAFLWLVAMVFPFL